jgi:hypothetical protein
MVSENASAFHESYVPGRILWGKGENSVTETGRKRQMQNYPQITQITQIWA